MSRPGRPARPDSPEPFDWLLFFNTFPFQPVPVWLVCALATKPLARATPWLLRATCAGPVREGVVNVAFVVYANLLPAAAAAAVYLFVGRRRVEKKTHRMIGDCGLALVVLLSASVAVKMAFRIREAWPTLGPGLRALGAACWK